jgi:translation elongation factor EF-G
MDSLEKQLEHYKKILGAGDIATRSYISAVKILEQQVDFLNNFNIKENISKATKDDATYSRASDMWEKMPKMISELHKLKNELGIEYVEKEEELIPVSPQNIGRLTN